MKKIILTGGGTAGHVTPNIALMPALRNAGYDIAYIGSKTGLERGLIEDCKVPYFGISSGKLRRYFSWKNFSDPFRVIAGYFQAKHIIKKERPDVIFSKGGFVSVPVVLAAKACHVPAIIHESDMTPGLANRIASRGAAKFCCNFPETLKHLPEGKAVLTGSPIRGELFHGNKDAAYAFTGLNDRKPVLLIMGGSQGSVFINQAVRGSLDVLLQQFQIIHLCGKGNLDEHLVGREGYVQYEYIGSQLPDLFAITSLVISRAGANAICELLALQIPNILIPLSLNASRGDQILNAKSFEKQGFSYVMDEESVNAESLTAAVQSVHSKRDDYINAMKASKQTDSVQAVLDVIQSV
ncbi:MAG: undecaprenyldiphospho-muramoylpentapeptide beta-N-acetylglucosaminyltransferase [Lachnospiraceae bacterium]|nr:undecaprenyldiphospho-muramoylpentapeptide beta-N-acetylglucosaminyltransferase [Lachnospiraceae bacterium]